MITPVAIYGATRGIADELAIQCRQIYLGMNFKLWFEWLFGKPIGNEFNPDKESAAPDLSYIGVVTQRSFQAGTNMLPSCSDSLQKVLFCDHSHDGKTGSACRRMAKIGMTIPQGTRTIDHSLIDLF